MQDPRAWSLKVGGTLNIRSDCQCPHVRKMKERPELQLKRPPEPHRQADCQDSAQEKRMQRPIIIITQKRPDPHRTKTIQRLFLQYTWPGRPLLNIEERGARLCGYRDTARHRQSCPAPAAASRGKQDPCRLPFSETFAAARGNLSCSSAWEQLLRGASRGSGYKSRLELTMLLNYALPRRIGRIGLR